MEQPVKLTTRVQMLEPTRDHARDLARPGASVDSDLLSALTGRQSNRDCMVAFRTRRVVSASHGLMVEQKEGRRRIRAVALAATVLVVLALGPLVWCAVDTLIADEHWRDVSGQFAMWVAILCPALVGCALLAGWVRNRE